MKLGATESFKFRGKAQTLLMPAMYHGTTGDVYTHGALNRASMLTRFHCQLQQVSGVKKCWCKEVQFPSLLAGYFVNDYLVDQK